MYEIVLNKKGAISKVFKVTLFDGTYIYITYVYIYCKHK